MEDWQFIVALFALLAAVATTGIVSWKIAFREGHAAGFRVGETSGYNFRLEEEELARQRMLLDTGRHADPRPDAAGTARVSQIRIYQL